MAQGIKEQIGTLATIEPKGHFVQIGREVLCANLVPATDDSTLEQRECGFDRVGVNVSIYVHLSRMLDGLMAFAMNASLNHRFGVSRPIVCNHHINVGAHVFPDVPSECSRFSIVGMKETEIATALADSDDNFLVSASMGTDTLTASSAAHIGFIHFDGTIQHCWLRFFHGSTNPMAEIPGGLIANSECPLHLVCTHSLSGFTEQISTSEPLNQWQVRIMENRVRCDGELVVTLGAVEQLCAISQTNDFFSAATDALRSIRPAQTLKQFSASVIGREQVAYIN